MLTSKWWTIPSCMTINQKWTVCLNHAYWFSVAEVISWPYVRIYWVQGSFNTLMTKLEAPVNYLYISIIIFSLFIIMDYFACLMWTEYYGCYHSVNRLWKASICIKFNSKEKISTLITNGHHGYIIYNIIHLNAWLLQNWVVLINCVYCHKY